MRRASRVGPLLYYCCIHHCSVSMYLVLLGLFAASLSPMYAGLSRCQWVVSYVLRFIFLVARVASVVVQQQ